MPETPRPVIASPCMKRCAISPEHGLCTGCGRTLNEIAAWSSLSEDERADIMARLPQRLAGGSPPRLRET